MDFPSYYTVEDVAKITGLSTRTIRNYLKDGKLQGKKIGVQWRFTEENIKNLFTFQEVADSMSEAKHQMVFDFLQKRNIEKAEVCTIYALACSSNQEAQEMCEQVLEVVNRVKKQGGLKFSFDYHDGLARYFLVGEPVLIQEVLEFLTKLQRSDFSGG